MTAMTAIRAPRHRGRGQRRGNFWPKARAALAAWWRGYVTWRNRELTKAMLRGLDDRTLKDIGLHRCEIGSVAYGTDTGRLQKFDGHLSTLRRF